MMHRYVMNEMVDLINTVKLRELYSKPTTDVILVDTSVAMKTFLRIGST